MVASVNDPVSAFAGFLTLWLIAILLVMSESGEGHTLLKAAIAGNHINMLSCAGMLWSLSDCFVIAITGCLAAWMVLNVGLYLLVEALAEKHASKEGQKEEQEEAKEKEKEERRFRYKETRNQLKSQKHEIERLKKASQWRPRPENRNRRRPAGPEQEEGGSPYFRQGKGLPE
jgi:flagellar biosynthesis component FlhA